MRKKNALWSKSRDEAKSAAERCDKELATVDRRLQENEAADRELLKKISTLQETEPPPADLQAQMDRLSTERARLPREKAEMTQARLGSAGACRPPREKLNAAEALVCAGGQEIARVRGEFEAPDRALERRARGRSRRK